MCYVKSSMYCSFLCCRIGTYIYIYISGLHLYSIMYYTYHNGTACIFMYTLQPLVPTKNSAIFCVICVPVVEVTDGSLTWPPGTSTLAGGIWNTKVMLRIVGIPWPRYFGVTHKNRIMIYIIYTLHGGGYNTGIYIIYFIYIAVGKPQNSNATCYPLGYYIYMLLRI